MGRFLGLFVAFGVVVAAGVRPAAGAPQTFLNAADWLNAVAGLNKPVLTLSPAIAPQGIRMADNFGEWTLDSPLVTFQEWGHTITHSRLKATGFVPAFGTLSVPSFTEGAFHLHFLCDGRFTQCLGLKTVEITFPEAIIGFGGNLRATFWDEIGIPLFVPVNEAAQSCRSLSCEYDGFFGVMFDAPVKNLRLDWSGGACATCISPDQASTLRFTDAFVVNLREPPGHLLLGSAFAVLGAAMLLSRRRMPTPPRKTLAS